MYGSCVTGRERVRACLEFSRPDRPPRDLWALPYVSLFQDDDLSALEREYPMDIARSQIGPGSSVAAMQELSEPGHYRDEWGSVWQVGEAGVLGEVKEPALPDWDALDGFEPPWSLVRDRDLGNVAAQLAGRDRFVLSDITARPFERLQFLRGTEALFMDIAYGSEELQRLLAMVHQFYLEDIAAWCKTDVDGVFLMDDWGTNLGLLISPDTWRELFRPLYRDYCELIHQAGKYAFFHTDGHTEAIYGDLIEVGFDAINSQLFVMDIEALASKYRGKVTFWGEIDRQRVLPFGTEEEVSEAVQRVRRALDDGSGGVIAQCEWGKHNPTANVRRVYAEWSGDAR